MSVKISTDSTADLSPELLAQHHISVIPLGIVKAGKLYHDGETITTADIAAHVDGGGEITTTSAVNIADYQDYFQSLSEQYDGVVHLNIGAEFSSCHQNARLAAQEFDNVFVADSRNLSTGQGLVVLAAAEAAEQGKSATEIMQVIEETVPRVEASFVLDRLDYMKKGGRCSTATALGANLLKIHPCLDLIDGKMVVTKKFRGSMEKVIADYIRDRLENRRNIDWRRVVLVDSCRTPGLVDTARKTLLECGQFQEILETHAGCTIFSHCGPDTLGIMFLRK